MDAALLLVRLGDPGFTLPAAGAMTAWLLAARAWRMALCWSLLFTAAIGLAMASKIAYMGWGGGWQALCYKALSGHATGATAVLPVLLFLLAGARWRIGAAVAGLALGALVAVALVAGGEHSAAEALGGWCAGAAASIGTIGLAGPVPPLRPPGPLLASLLAFAAGAWLMQWAHLGWWMIRAARLLSGHEHLFKLNLH